MKDFVFRENNGVQVLICEPFEHAGFKNGFSTRLGGVSPLPAAALSLGNFHQDERANVLENRRRFLHALGVPDWPLVTARQIHSADVRLLRDADDARSEPTACDALTANLPNAFLAVQTADCLPVLLADERSGALAAIHAGWRGTLAGIVARTIERMQLSYDTRPEHLRAALGPAIGACCFEVGPEVIEQFERAFAFADAAVTQRQPNGKGHLNLNLINTQQLLACGVLPERIYDAALCTFCRTDLFFSYRRERGAKQPVGRLMGVIGRAAISPSQYRER